ncbi:enoyl-ACP reductase FabI [Algihabitans albus]|uniref:enoyl-ACP reductase FabI n=1 Tax=Algihabitans albus TaxID=2164067 RepID=UPI000E5CF238|nr:enoyl-ACP reductase FabI [Algihabitans albus]
MFSLNGKRGLVIGIANDQSIAYGCARQFRRQGAELAVTYLNTKAEPYVRPLADELEAGIVFPCDVREPGQLEAVFAEIEARWGRLDFLLHSIAYAPKNDLHGRVVDCSQAGFLQAMDVSCHSFLRMAKLAEPLMEKAGGGCLMTVTFYGAEKVVQHYNLMGPVKAALEAATRYMAAELGEKGIRAHAISPGPLLTRAASGLDRFEALMDQARDQAPGRRLVTIDEIGALAVYLASDEAAASTGTLAYIDGGYSIMD